MQKSGRPSNVVFYERKACLVYKINLPYNDTLKILFVVRFKVFYYAKEDNKVIYFIK